MQSLRSKKRAVAVVVAASLLVGVSAAHSLPAQANGLSCGDPDKIFDGGANNQAWSAAANWDPDGVPIETDHVCITNGHIAGVQDDASAASVVVLPGGAVSIGNDKTLTVAGDITSEGTFTSFGNVDVGGAITSGLGSLTLRNSSLVENGVNVSSGTLALAGIIYGDVTVSNTEMSLSENSVGDVNVMGDFTLSNSNVEFNVYRYGGGNDDEENEGNDNASYLISDTLAVAGNFALATATATVIFGGSGPLATNPIDLMLWEGTSPMEEFAEVTYKTEELDDDSLAEYTFSESYTGNEFQVIPATGDSPEPQPGDGGSGGPEASPPPPGISAPVKVGDDGSVITVPTASTPAAPAAIAATPSGAGSWTVTPDGGVFTAGDAQFVGSMGGEPLNAPMVGITPTPSGAGYLLVGLDGGVFTYGDATFQGSMGGSPLNAPISSIASTCSNSGYYLVADDGGVFAFGDAAFLGSMGGTTLNEEMVGIVPACDNGSYWTFSEDGGVFTFGNAQFYGSLADNTPPGGVIGMVPAPDRLGYWLIGADRKAYGFGSVG